jgi:Lon protease-like protein
MGDSESSPLDLSAVPLFPLPNVVLFPRAVLPLHIFEERYKTMTADALAGDGLIAMALLRPGWEKSYYGKAAIEPVVCVGRILTHEKLPDGKYNFLLQGRVRARIVREVGQRVYRQARLEVLRAAPEALEIDLSNDRRRLVDLFTSDVFATTGLAGQFRQLLAGAIPTADVADLIAFSYFENVALKQSLLAEADVRRRVTRTVEELQNLRPWVRSAVDRTAATASRAHAPPSMN